MNARLEKVENCEAYVEFEIEASVVEEAMEKAYQQVGKTAEVPGYKKGKAPREALEKHLGKEKILQAALDIFVPDAYYAAVKELGIDAIAEPDIEVGHIVDGQPVAVKAIIPLKPEVILGDIEGLEITVPTPVKVNETEVSRYIENLRYRYAKVTDKFYEAAEYGDTVTIDYTGYMEGQDFQGENNIKVRLESGEFIPGFPEKLLGAKKGDQLNFTLSFPKASPVMAMAGKDIAFSVTVKKVENVQLPALDNVFAQEVAHVNTIDELRDFARNELNRQENLRCESLKQQAILDAALEKSEVNIPEIIILKRVAFMLEEFTQRLINEGQTLEAFLKQTNSSKELLQAQLFREAKAITKSEYLLDKIITEKGFEVSEEEIEYGCEETARSMGMDIEGARENLGPLVNRVIFDLKAQKAIQYMLDHAVIKERKIALTIPGNTNLN